MPEQRSEQLPDHRLGIQLWLERDDTAERVDRLIASAAGSGFGQVRIFLLWPWIQAESSSAWDFRLWDAVFDAAERHGVSVKATLTANSGPWWLGTSSVLHSDTLTLDEGWLAPQEAYVAACVARYRDHPALGQWILWNEPGYPYDPVHPQLHRPVGAAETWAEVLRGRYGDIRALNARWRSGYRDFGEVPFVEAVAHPAHMLGSQWISWAPVLDDVALRSRLLRAELARVAAVVRRLDATTPMAANPNQTLSNHAQYGYGLGGLAETVDVLGASFHAPWSFAGFADVDDHTPLVVAGLGLLRNTPGRHSVEVTEVQTGNTFYAGAHALGVGAAEMAATFLAPLLAGAESVTGWLFNTRHGDFEAGEWGLLDDDDRPGERSQAVGRVRTALGALDSTIGAWRPAPAVGAVLVSERSQAVQFALSLRSETAAGSDAAAAIRGAALATVALARLGVPSELVPVESFEPEGSRLVAALHLAAWDRELADALLAAADGGATVLIDATSGEFDGDITLHRPWPGILAESIGARSTGLVTAHDGAPLEVRRLGSPLGLVAPVAGAMSLDDAAWTAVPELVFAHDSSPVLWRRPWGRGWIYLCRAALAVTVAGDRARREVLDAVLDLASRPIERPVRPLSPLTVAMRVDGERGSAIGVFGPPVLRRRGEPLAMAVPRGAYLDLWSGTRHEVGHSRTLTLDSPDGIALLVQP